MGSYFLVCLKEIFTWRVVYTELCGSARLNLKLLLSCKISKRGLMSPLRISWIEAFSLLELSDNTEETLINDIHAMYKF